MVGADERDELIRELLAESFGLRTKAEHLSQYVESKVAELVKLRRNLAEIEAGEERRRLVDELGLVRTALEDAVRRRNEAESRLDALLAEHGELARVHQDMSEQRDRLRERMSELERSREYRVGSALARWLPFLRSGRS